MPLQMMKCVISSDRSGTEARVSADISKKEVWRVLSIFRIQSLRPPRMPMSAGFPVWRIYRRVPENISENISMEIPYRA